MTFKRWLKKIYYGNLPENLRAFPYYGAKVYFPKDSIIFRAACQTGIYEGDNVKLLLALAEKGTHGFDIGANIGLMAVPLLASDKELTIVSFEPSPNSLPYLRRTVNESRFGKRWSVVGKAAGESVGTTSFYISRKNMGALDGLRGTGRTARALTTVEVTTVDAEWTALGKPRVSLLKIDAEGSEKLVLGGASACIAANNPSILLEWNGVNLKAFDCSFEWLIEFARQIDYLILSTLGMTVVEHATALRATMALTESFLLVPRLRKDGALDASGNGRLAES